MQYSPFQLNKVRRLINTWGQNFSFSYPGKNLFNEPTEETETLTLRGLYHQSSSTLTKSSEDSTTTRTKPAPQILCLWSEVEKLKLEDLSNYQVEFNSRKYQISGIVNLGEANTVAEISLEEVLTNGLF